jgi:hypothetical protein
LTRYHLHLAADESWAKGGAHSMYDRKAQARPTRLKEQYTKRSVTAKRFRYEVFE